jgi:hypothetical protein
MQEGIQYTSLPWKQLAFYIVASFIGGGGAYKLINIWLNWKKPEAEIHVTEAQAVKTRAEARKIDADADLQVNTIIERLHVRIDQMQEGVDEIRGERDELKMRCDMQDIELNLRDRQMKKMKGILDARGIKLSDFDQPNE